MLTFNIRVFWTHPNLCARYRMNQKKTAVLIQLWMTLIQMWATISSIPWRWNAMSIVSQFGKPSFFITMTCNLNWPEIVWICSSKCRNFRTELIIRVFRGKLKELKHAVVTKEFFGKITAYRWFWTVLIQTPNDLLFQSINC